MPDVQRRLLPTEWALRCAVVTPITERIERSYDALAAKPITAAQDPLGFEQHRRVDVDVLVADQRTRLRELLGIVAGQIADDDISIDREHCAALLQP